MEGASGGGISTKKKPSVRAGLLLGSNTQIPADGQNQQRNEMSNLARLLRPKSIAVVGGGAWGTAVVEQCRRIGFDGPLWPVHPKRTEVAGMPAYATLADLPGIPDATFIGVNRVATVEVVQALRDMGGGGAVCFASGFREAQMETKDGADLQEALLAAAGEMPIIGPNCYGFINYLDGALLWPDQHGGQRCERGVAILTQSSNMAINLTMQDRGLPLAYMATAGNQAQQGLADIGTALLEDPRVTALGLHIEGIGDLRSFEAMAATARRLGKSIVALKSGRSEAAQAAAVSHTASLTGSDAGARALLDRLGIARVTSLSQLLECLKLLHFAGPLRSNRIASMSCSGGEASLVSDSALDHDIIFPALDADQRAGLRAVLGPMVALANPLDYHTFIWGDADRMGAAFTAITAGRDVDMGIIICDFPRTDRCDPSAWDCIIEGGARATAETGTPIALVATLPDACPEIFAERVVAAGLIPLAGLDEALCAIANAARLGSARDVPEPVLLPGPDLAETDVLSEADAKADLQRYGVPIPAAQRLEALPAQPAEVSLTLPVVLKGEGFAHKTEAGAVVLNLQSAEEVLAAMTRLKAPAYLVEEMITGGVAELLIGVVKDPAHGFVLTIAAGGVMTELMQDSVSLLLPVREEEVVAALGRLRIAALLRGYRGKPAADMAAIAKAVMAVQAYVTDHAATLQEVEINPLICTPDRAVAADALIRIAK